MLSIIIPIGPEDRDVMSLSTQLFEMMDNVEVLCVGTDCLAHESVRKIILDCPSRAVSLNEGARQSTGNFLWFVHADSRLDPLSCAALQTAISQKPDALHYFDVKFYDGSALMRLTELGVKFRCRLFGNPFGDQAFCLSKKLFDRLGGYPEDVRCGEDHFFVLNAKKNDVRLNNVLAKIGTSARKYIDHGWFKMTTRYLFLTTKQMWEAQRNS